MDVIDLTQIQAGGVDNRRCFVFISGYNLGIREAGEKTWVQNRRGCKREWGGWRWPISPGLQSSSWYNAEGRPTCTHKPWDWRAPPHGQRGLPVIPSGVPVLKLEYITIRQSNMNRELCDLLHYWSASTKASIASGKPLEISALEATQGFTDKYSLSIDKQSLKLTFNMHAGPLRGALDMYCRDSSLTPVWAR